MNRTILIQLLKKIQTFFKNMRGKESNIEDIRGQGGIENVHKDKNMGTISIYTHEWSI